MPPFHTHLRIWRFGGIHDAVDSAGSTLSKVWSSQILGMDSSDLGEINAGLLVVGLGRKYYKDENLKVGEKTIWNERTTNSSSGFLNPKLLKHICRLYCEVIRKLEGRIGHGILPSPAESESGGIRRVREVRNNNKPAGTNTPEDINMMHVYWERTRVNHHGCATKLSNVSICRINRRCKTKRKNRAGTMQPASDKSTFQLVSLETYFIGVDVRQETCTLGPSVRPFAPLGSGMFWGLRGIDIEPDYTRDKGDESLRRWRSVSPKSCWMKNDRETALNFPSDRNDVGSTT